MGKLILVEAPLSGAFVVETTAFIDDRGSFSRFFCSDELKDILDDKRIVNINYSSNVKSGTIRGIHTQMQPNAEIKLVRCVRGALFDVIVDLRQNSTTFLKSFAVELTEENQKMLIVPEGFGHSFQTLKDESDALYCTTAPYNSSSELSINYADPLLGISWPLPISQISDKDATAPFLPTNFKGL